MNGINYIIIKENNTRKTKRIEKKLKTCISKFGPYIIILLKDFEIKFFICNMKKNTKLDGKGCYFLTNEHNKWIINIYIDNCKYFNVKKILYHEIGHFADEVIGCYENNVDFSLDNCKKFCFSITNKQFIYYNKMENDFFTQLNYIENDSIFFYDLKESFADCFSELVTGCKRFYMERCKSSVYKALLKYCENA